MAEQSYLEKAENYIAILRNRKAEKIYQTARLYLKLKEFNSALIYFDEVLKKYSNSVIALLGKGRENYQIFHNNKTPHSDVNVIKKYLHED